MNQNGQSSILYAAAGIIILLLAVILLMYIRHRQVVREKSRGIIRQIQKQDELAKELERSRIEKETLMEFLIRKETEKIDKTEYKDDKQPRKSPFRQR